MEDGVKISELTQLTSLNGEGAVPIVNGNQTKQINIVDLVYPVGAIYISANSTNPSAIFGGTWEQIQGRYLLAAGAPSQNTNTSMGSLTQEQLTWNFTAGETLGEYTHTLSSNEIPNFKFQVPHIANMEQGYGGIQNVSVSQSGTGVGYEGEAHSVTGTRNSWKYELGGGQAHNTMSASLVVYMWKRTA